MPSNLNIVFLWHMHQPLYLDPYTRRFELPWVRMHALKDYFGMVRILKDFPQIKATYNLVPSLLVQLEGYLKGQRDVFQDMFIKDAESLSPGEIAFLIRHFFSPNYDNLVKPFPRYEYLYNKRQAHKDSNKKENWGKVFNRNEIRDIQVWFSLCYFDEEYKENDDRIRGLIEKGKDFTEEDKRIIEETELELMGKIIPEYKKYLDTGQVEISTSPFYHPILPLLSDPQQGRIANPDLPPYPLYFNWQEDAIAQVESALDYMEKIFGKRPVGMWPSEGSLSTEVLGIFEDLGIKWTAADEINLSHSLSVPIERDRHFTVKNPGFFYKPYVLNDRNIKIFFRDHHLSDLIGFHYRKMSYKRAARDLIHRIKAIGVSAFKQKENIKNKELVVPIILDGENAWEYYHQSGRDFLKAFFRMVEEDDTLKTVTFSECLDMEPGVIKDFRSGSWINGNFDIWIGNEEDQRAWQMIEAARNAFERQKSQLSEKEKQEILEYIYIAEGSDWFWWFGKENDTPDLYIFDRLLRKNLQKVYDLLAVAPSANLFSPISNILKKTGIETVSPKAYINPEIDGKESHYFEWLHAGSVEVSVVGGAMTVSNPMICGLFYGFDKHHLYLRIDTPQHARFYFEQGYTLDIVMMSMNDNDNDKDKDKKKSVISLNDLNKDENSAIDIFIECKVPLSSISIKEGEWFYLYLEWKFNGEFFQTIPTHGYFTLTVPTPRDYAHFWLV